MKITLKTPKKLNNHFFCLLVYSYTHSKSHPHTLAIEAGARSLLSKLLGCRSLRMAWRRESSWRTADASIVSALSPWSMLKPLKAEAWPWGRCRCQFEATWGQTKTPILPSSAQSVVLNYSCYCGVRIELAVGSLPYSQAIPPTWKSEASLECRQSGSPITDPTTDLSRAWGNIPKGRPITGVIQGPNKKKLTLFEKTWPVMLFIKHPVSTYVCQICLNPWWMEWQWQKIVTLSSVSWVCSLCSSKYKILIGNKICPNYDFFCHFLHLHLPQNMIVKLSLTYNITVVGMAI